MALAEALGSAPVKHLVVIHTGPDVRGERRRRKCLELVFLAFSAREVIFATFESRGPADDKRDMPMLGGLRSAEVRGSSLWILHHRDPEDPLRWLSEALCGVVTSVRTGEPEYREQIKHTLKILQCEPTRAKPRALSSGRKSRGSLPSPPRWTDFESCLALLTPEVGHRTVPDFAGLGRPCWISVPRHRLRRCRRRNVPVAERAPWGDLDLSPAEAPPVVVLALEADCFCFEDGCGEVAEQPVDLNRRGGLVRGADE